MDYREKEEQRKMIFKAYIEQKLVKKYGLKVIRVEVGSNRGASVTLSGDREKFIKYIMSKDYEPQPYLTRDDAESIVDTGVYYNETSYCRLYTI